MATLMCPTPIVYMVHTRRGGGGLIEDFSYGICHLIKKFEKNWAKLTFSKTSGTVNGMGKNLANSMSHPQLQSQDSLQKLTLSSFFSRSGK